MFWKSAVNLLKKVLMIGAQAAPAIVGAYNAPLGALLSTLFNSILVSHASNPAADNESKKETAMAILQAAMPQIEQMFLASDKAIHDPAGFASGVEKLHDGLLDILNSTGLPATATK